MDMVDSELFLLFKNLATQLPELLVLLLGLILSIARWNAHPKAALLAFLGFGSLILLKLAFTAAYVFLPRFLLDANRDSVTSMYTIINLIRAFLTGGAYLLLIFAILAGMRPRTPRPTFSPRESERASTPMDRVGPRN